MLTGEPPFTGPTAQAIVGKVLTDQPRPIHELRRTVLPHVEEAVLTALEKLPADRFASTAEFADALADEGPRRVRTMVARATSRDAARATRYAIIAGVLGVTTVLALAWDILQTIRRASAPPVPVVRFRLPADLARMSSGKVVSIAPDGSKLVTVEFLPGGLQTHLVLRYLDREQTTPIAGSEGALSPFFSPDGAWIAFAAGSYLKKARIDGGPGSGNISTITDVGPADFVGLGAWGDDGTIVFVSRNGHLYRVPAAGGAAARVTRAATDPYDGPVWLPGGKRILVTHYRPADVNYDLMVLSAETGDVLARLGSGLALQYVTTGDVVYAISDGTIMTVPFNPRTLQRLGPPTAFPGPRFSYRGRTIMAAVSATGTVVYATNSSFLNGELVRLDATGKPTVFPLGVRGFRGPRFSPDGRRIVVDVESGGDLVGDIWVYDQAPATFTRLTFEGSSVLPEWMPDGSAVLYSALGKNGLRGIYRVPVDRSAPPMLVREGKWPVFEAVVAPRNNTLLVRENADSTGRDIVMIPSGGNATPFASGPFQERSPAIT